MTVAASKSRTSGKARDEYMALITQFPPRPIRDEAAYNATVAAMNKMAVRDEGTLSEAEEDYLLALTRFVEDYDRAHYLPQRRRRDPVRILKTLMDQREMTTADLGRLLGSSSLASAILKGKRGLSKTHIRTLSAHFKVNPSLLL